MTEAIAGIQGRVEPAAGALGAYVHGFDIARSLTAERVSFVQDVIRRHHVVCFRGQDITPQQHKDFTRTLGDFYVQPVVSGLEGHPEIVEVFGTHRSTESWHQDSTHGARPPRFSILVARIVPPFGNDTQFSNQHLAYEALSEAMKDLLRGLRAVHATLDSDVAKDSRYREVGRLSERSSHPVVRTHPDTGRKALYVNAMYTRHFDGMTEAESLPLLHYLWGHCGRADFSFRHRWLPGDVLIWDNASVQHAVIADMPQGTERYLHRTTTIGEEPI